MVKLKQDPNKRHYFTEVPGNEALEVLRKAIADKVEIKVWEEGKSEEEVETYLALEVDPKTLETSLEHQGGLLSKLFTSKLVGKSIFIKIGSGKFQFFSTAKLSQNNKSKHYVFNLSAPLFKTQQRSNYRLHASSQVRIQFRLSEEILHDALDISAGGTSFIVPKEEQDTYSKGTSFKGCRLIFLPPLSLGNGQQKLPKALMRNLLRLAWPLMTLVKMLKKNSSKSSTLKLAPKKCAKNC